MQRKASSKPKTDAEIILEAIQEAARRRERELRRRRRKERFLWLQFLPGWIKGLFITAFLLLVVLIADGIRREGKEFTATLVAFQGQVFVRPYDGKGWVRPSPDMTLRDKDIVRTGANGIATIAFPDGSALQLEPNTEFEVRLLDFARGNLRDRSFLVHFGAAVAYISRFFGTRSKVTICTPTAVAAVRGTGFRVFYDPRTKRTSVHVVEGQVQFRTPLREVLSAPGQIAAAMGYHLLRPQGLPSRQRQQLSWILRQLRQYEHPPHWLQRVEWALTNFFDPVLQIFGLVPGGWGYKSIDFARRAACMEALRRLRIHIESLPEGPPDYLNPITLEELNLHPKERERILNAFSGKMLESYRKTGARDYIVRARARDKRRTLYEMTLAEIRKVPE